MDSVSGYLELSNVYNCFEKGCPTEKHKSVHDNTKRHDGSWLFTVESSSSQVLLSISQTTIMLLPFFEQPLLKQLCI